MLAYFVTGVTAASSGTSDSRISRISHTHTLVQKTGVSPVRRHWRAQQRDVSLPEGGRADTGRGLRDVFPCFRTWGLTCRNSQGTWPRISPIHSVFELYMCAAWSASFKLELITCLRFPSCQNLGVDVSELSKYLTKITLLFTLFLNCLCVLLRVLPLNLSWLHICVFLCVRTWGLTSPSSQSISPRSRSRTAPPWTPCRCAYIYVVYCVYIYENKNYLSIYVHIYTYTHIYIYLTKKPVADRAAMNAMRVR